jgi:carbon starvation protein
MVGENLLGRSGGAVSLAAGMSLILSSIPGMKTLMGYWYHFAIMFEALFILTTVDTGTRVARYIFQEMAKSINPKFGSSTWMPAVLLGSAVITISWGYLVYYGDIKSIWPLFGVANQLLATIALLIGTVFILKNSRNWKYAMITFIPSLFMLVTTITAGFLTIFNNYLPMNNFGGNLNAALSFVMIILVLIIFVETIRKMLSIFLHVD